MIVLKLNTCSLVYSGVMHLKDGDGLENRVNYSQTAPSGSVPFAQTALSKSSAFSVTVLYVH